MSKRQFKGQASSSRVDQGVGFGGFGTVFAGSTLSYLSEPPNLSSITDANVVVAFKNLLKKDSITKAKGLEDLRSHVQSHPYEQDEGVEQPVLEAWVKMYPRISIDNSRRVRELSHIVQFELLTSARKRMEKFIPRIVGAWLAGTYDKDRPVARAANDGITSFLDTEEKLLSFWRKCQTQILDYAQEAIKETPQTLSDERNTSSDDLSAKFDRVMGASMSLINNLLLKLNEKDFQKHQEAYENFLSNNKLLWGFITSSDSFLRRTSAQLLSTCLDKESMIIEKDVQLVSHAFIDEGLRASQSGSALQLLQALNKLTQKFPEVWMSAYKGKKPALVRLRKFVERGSQSGPPEFWQSFTSLIIGLPPGVLPTEIEGALDLLKAQRDGISNREEARTNMPVAWKSYFDITKHIMTGLPDSTDINRLSRNAIYPLFEQFLLPAPSSSAWSMSNSTVALAKAFYICWDSENDTYPQALADEWKRLAENLAANMTTSLPEQSKDYAKSQAAIVSEARRWFSLQEEIIKSAKSTIYGISLESIVTFLSKPSFSLIMKALEVLRNRNGKPYGAAGTLEASLRMTPELIIATPVLDQAIISFLENDAPQLILSPSFEYLIASLYAFRPLPGHGGVFESTWQAAMDGLLTSSDSDRKIKAVQELISDHTTSSLAQKDVGLQEYLFKHTSQLIEGQPANWAVFESATTFNNLSSETANNVVSLAVDCLNGESLTVDGPLRVLEYLAQKKPQLLRDVDVNHLTIMTRLLALTESQDSITISRANALKARIEGQDNPAVDTDQVLPPILEIIRDNLNTSGPQSLTIDTLVRQAHGFINTNGNRITGKIFPDTKRWFEALQPSLQVKPNPTLSMISSVGSVVLLVQTPSDRNIPHSDRDINGYSTALRMALYTSKLVSGLEDLNSLDPADQVEILWLLILTQLLTSDQIGLEEDNKLWSSLTDPNAESQVQDFVASSYIQSVATANNASTWRNSSQEGHQSVAQKLVAKLICASRDSSLVAFYAAHALSILVSVLVETHGWKNSGGDEWLSSQDILKASTSNTFTSVGVLFGLQDVLGSSKLLNNLSNRLISDVTGASPKQEKTLSILILLNATMATYEPGKLPVAQNRLVFAVKQLISWMAEDEQISLPVAAETCKCLQILLFSIKDVYGPYWQATLDFSIDLWKKPAKGNLDERLPALQNSLKLFNMLKSIQEPNDDLVDALSDSSESLSHGLLNVLRLPRTKENQPWRIFDELLFRNLMEIPLEHIKDPSRIYPSIASEFYFIQLAAFYTLNRVIPAAQEQISVDVLLEKTDARLPEELLSLLLDAPVSENFPDEILVQFPPLIRTYLFSWQLVFAAYPRASHKVRSDYSEVLKSENYISPLLDFLFDVLGHSTAQPINLDKAGFTPSRVRQYDLKAAEAETDEKKMQWILVNLYYLCLKYAPNLAKNWWMNCKSKQTRIAVGSWTESYFSPLVISDTIDEVATWAELQESPTDDEKELLIKNSKKSGEIYVGCEVDDMQMQIVIRLPTIYPLEGVKVDGINRVAVAEKKWQSWLMITQGVITFSNGSIIDGLIAFKKNVTGALKGQTECAICYSIISSDKKMPDKRCQTCKNLFHSSCLFKWFASSNQSTCPLCRNPFNYGTDSASRARRRGGPE